MLEISNTFSFEQSKIYAEKLETEYPFLSCAVIGRTYLGRGIFAFSLGCRSNSVLITGGTGGKSSQTSLMLYRFLDRLCGSIYFDSEISGINFSALIKKFGITVIPCLSPDSQNAGDERNSNYAGVDIDLNFDSDWRKEKINSLENNILFACAEGFPGNFKESEPETRAFTSFCRRRGFRSCLTLRYGENTCIHYKRDKKAPATSSMMAKILASSSLCAVSEDEMPASPSRWFVDEFSRPAFLFEIEKQENAELLYKKTEEALVLMSVM